MKKFILLLVILVFTLQANAAMKYKDAFAKNGKIPMAMLIYADWAQDYNETLTMFKKLESTLSNSYNFVELNIADKETKDYSETYSILPKMPYIMLYRSSGKVQRVLDRDCALDLNCAVPKMKSFIRQ